MPKRFLLELFSANCRCCKEGLAVQNLPDFGAVFEAQEPVCTAGSVQALVGAAQQPGGLERSGRFLWSNIRSWRGFWSYLDLSGFRSNQSR